MGRRAIVLLVALILAGLAAWAVWNFMQNVRNEEQEGQRLVTVYRSGGADGIPEGTEGSILVSDYNNGGTLIVESQDQFEDTPADAIQSEEELRQVLTGKVAAGEDPRARKPAVKGRIRTVARGAARVEATLFVRPLAG